MGQRSHSEPPKSLVCYKTLPEWDSKTLPRAFRARHNTKEGTWAKIEIFAGRLRFDHLGEDGEVLASDCYDASSNIPMVGPQVWHRVEPESEDLRMRLSFYCQEESFFEKKYKLTATHSEVRALSPIVPAGRALDIGCGRGRNALFLNQQGFVVDALDPKPEAIETLKGIIAQEKLSDLTPLVSRAQDFVPQHQYELVLATVVLMFLPSQDVITTVKMMQEATAMGGFNLIVCAMESPEYPLSRPRIPFSFGFRPGELRALYQGWEMQKYNEELGHLHRLDEAGNPIALNFVTLLARKPAG